MPHMTPFYLALTTAIIAMSSISSSAAAETSRELRTIVIPTPSRTSQFTTMHCAVPRTQSSVAVLFVHGASFPTLLASGFRFKPGDSWLDFVARRGWLACGLDFSGFGASSRPEAMSEDPAGREPLTRAPQAAEEISRAVALVRKVFSAQAVHMVAHSWGTIPAAMHAAHHPQEIASLVLFGPIVPGEDAASKPVIESWWSITAQGRYEQLRFEDVLPANLDLLEPAVHKRWAAEFARSAPGALALDQQIRIPAGPLADIAAASGGEYPYSAEKITIPVLTVYGSYDTECDDTRAAAFMERITASPLKWRVRIDHGTHVLHLEKNRWSLYETVDAFMRAAGTPALSAP
jgi:pimeloyl-ACP methyl ester carboxylesterase